MPGNSQVPLLAVAATVKELNAAFGGFGIRLGDSDDQGSFKTSGRRVDLLVTGVGLVASAMNLAAYLAGKREYAGVLNVGIAGSYDLDRLELGRVAVAESEHWPEYGLETESGVSSGKLGFPIFNRDGQEIWSEINLAPKDKASEIGLELGPDIEMAGFNSVSTIPGSTGRAALTGESTGALVENMEGFALALVCVKFHLPFLEVRSISNLAGARDRFFWNLPLAFKSLGRAMAGIFKPQRRSLG